MADNMYEVIALIPPNTDFSLDRAVHHFSSLPFRKLRLRTELANAEGASAVTGFRVWYGDWSIMAWLDDAPGVLTDSQDLASKNPPDSGERIASCDKRLSVWSDEDQDGDHSDEMTHFTDKLRERFGVFIYDPVNSEWWT